MSKLYVLMLETDDDDDDYNDRFAGNQKKEAEPELKDLRDRLLNLLLDAASTHPYTTGYDHPDDKSMTIAQIQDKDSLLASVSNQRISAILRRMMSEGIVDYQVHKRKNFYFITEKYYRLEKEKQEAEERKKLEERIKKFPKEFKSHKEKILDILSKSDCPLSSTGIYHSITGLNGKSMQMVNDILAKLVSERKIQTLEKTSTTYYYVANGHYTRNLSELGDLKKTALKLEGEISKSDDLYRKNRFNPFRQKAAKSALEEKQKYESELRKTRAKIEDLEKKTMVQ